MRGHYVDSIPSGSPRRSINVVLVVAAVVIACVSFLTGRLTAPKTAVPAGAGINADTAGGAYAGGASTTTPAMPSSTGITVTDPAGDAVPHPTSDGRVYGPSDIVSLSVRSQGTYLVITTVYTPSTPMNLLSTETDIRLNPDGVPSCKNSVLDSSDWAIIYDTNGIDVLKPPNLNCGDKFQHTSITGAADISGSTLTIKISQDSLGIRPGQRIVVRGCVSTRIDDSHTTFIQDWAPDSSAGTTGTV